MSASQRRKGAAYELEVAKQFAALMQLPVPKRELSQTRDGGHDLKTGPFSIECKRRRELKTLRGWLAQAESGTDATTPWPIVLCREDNGKTMALMSLETLGSIFSLYHEPIPGKTCAECAPVTTQLHARA